MPLVAPLMAVAEERGHSGVRLIEAYLVGIETEIRLARAVNFVHYDKGWHPTATVGIFGTVAAVGHLIGMPESSMTTAFGIAASLASGLKQFPCCGSTHPAIAAMLALREQEGVRAADVAKIDVMPHGRRLRHTNTPNPHTPLQAKFSVQYVVARALLDGAVRLGHFEEDAPLQPAIRALLAKTAATAHPDMADDAAHQFSAEVRVTRNDGRVVSRRIDNLVGRGGTYPMSSDELWEKFSDCGVRSLPGRDLPPLFERLEAFESVADSGADPAVGACA